MSESEAQGAAGGGETVELSLLDRAIEQDDYKSALCFV